MSVGDITRCYSKINMDFLSLIVHVIYGIVLYAYGPLFSIWGVSKSDGYDFTHSEVINLYN